MPLVAAVGAPTAARWEDVLNAGLAAFGLLLAWWVAGRIGVERLRDRFALVLLLGFGTQMWWVTTRGGVWRTGHLFAIILAMLMLAELFGKQRAFLLGLLIGMSFLTRAPTAFVAPAVALWYLVAASWARPASAAGCAGCHGAWLSLLLACAALAGRVLRLQPRAVRPARVRLRARDAARLAQARRQRACSPWSTCR